MPDDSFFAALVALLPEDKREAAWRIFARMGERDEDSFLVQMLLLMELHIRWFEAAKSGQHGASSGQTAPSLLSAGGEDFRKALAERRAWEDAVVRDVRRLRDQVSRAWLGMVGAAVFGLVIGFFLGSCAR